MIATARMDAATVKAAAFGRWLDILPSVGGVDPDILNGLHHPCPKCGGHDRFRTTELDAGALFCNRCFSQKNGDGLAALMWLRGWSLPEAIAAVAEYLGLSNSNGKASTKTETSKNNGKSAVSVSVSQKKPAETGHKEYRERFWTWCFRAAMFTVFRDQQPGRAGDSVRGHRPVHYAGDAERKGPALVRTHLDRGRHLRAAGPIGLRFRIRVG